MRVPHTVRTLVALRHLDKQRRPVGFQTDLRRRQQRRPLQRRLGLRLGCPRRDLMSNAAWNTLRLRCKRTGNRSDGRDSEQHPFHFTIALVVLRKLGHPGIDALLGRGKAARSRKRRETPSAGGANAPGAPSICGGSRTAEFNYIILALSNGRLKFKQSFETFLWLI